MNNPEVSVVITMYREGKLLAETIDSILAQTFRSFEILLVDNNADTETVRIAQLYVDNHPDHVRMVKEPIQGVSAAKNRGIRESRGTYVALHDGDDLSHPERLELQWLIMKDRPELSVVCSWFDRVGPDGKEIIKKDISESTPHFWFRTEQILKDFYPDRSSPDPASPLNFSLISTTFFRKETAIAAGLFDDRFNPRWFEDFEFLSRMYEMGEFYKIPISLLRYRMHTPERAAILRKQMNWVALIKHLDLFYRILWERYHNRSKDAPLIFSRLRAFWLGYISDYFLQYQQGTKLGRMVLTRAILSNPADRATGKLWLKSFMPQSSHPKLFWFDALTPGPLPEGADKELVQRIFRQEHRIGKTPPVSSASEFQTKR